MNRLTEVVTTANATTFGAAASFAGKQIHLPESTQIREGLLEWSDALLVGGIRGGRLDSAGLRHFVRLADAHPEKMASFAKRFGPLYLGMHGYPVENLEDLPRRIDEDEAPIIGPYIKGKPLVTHRVWYQEPIEGWRAWARYVGMVLLLCHELRAGERIVPDVRLKRCGFDPGPKNPEFNDDSQFIARNSDGEFELSELGRTVYDRLWPWRLLNWLDDCSTVDEQWAMVAGDVNLRLLHVTSFELYLGGTILSPKVNIDRPLWQRKFGMHVDSALPTIAGQLLAIITSGQYTQLCAACRLPYPVKRRRENGRCPECRSRERSASVQRSKAKRRARENELIQS